MKRPTWRILRLLVALLFVALSPSGGAGNYKSITIDGNFDDWIGVPLAHEDPADAATASDYRKIWVANDESYLYLRFNLDHPENPFTANDNIFIDADADPSTGFILLQGSEMLIQGGVGYQEKNGGFNEGPIEGLDWQASPTGDGMEFEVRISRSARFAEDGSAVFQSPLISLLLEAEDANFTRMDTAPDGEGLPYEFADQPPPLTGSAQLVPANASWRYNASGTDPGSDWSGLDFDDAGAGWASGTPLFGYTADAGAYPLPIVTPLPSSTVIAYFRTHFDWNNATTGVAFALTNVLSDGAVIYLNGAEVKRIRMPAGPITSSTPALGGPTTPGQPELLALPTGPLVQGDNVVAVEIHQATQSPADLVFGLTLLASSEFPVTFPDATQPADVAVVAGESVTLSAELLASGPVGYQWLKDGEPIAGATVASLVLSPVLPESAGVYSLRVTNAVSPEGVSSRGAVLTVLGTPVAITRQPAPATTTEGRTVEFSVAASGSAPLRYQWFHGAVAVSGATNDTLVLTNVALIDAGDYAVEVSNPAPSSVRSASASLTVVEDSQGPGLLQVNGGPGRVTLTFDEPLDPVSAVVMSNYTLTGGLTVTAAALDETDPSIVILSVPGQSLGTRYDLTVGNIEDRFGNKIAAGLHRTFLSTIQIDGSFDDWAGIAPAAEDPVDAENATDYAAVWIASDGDFIYLRVQLHVPSEFASFLNNIFIDADYSVETGLSFHGIGSEMLLQGGSGYQEKNGAFNEGTIDGLGWQMAPGGVDDEFELRFSRNATYTSDGERVFVNPTIALFVESENSSFVTVDLTPDVEPIVHELSTAVPGEPGRISIERGDSGFQITWDGPGVLQATGSLSAPAWQEVAGAASPHAIQPLDAARFFRLAQ